MPLYEYVCPNCNLKFELLRSLTQVNEEAFCPRCRNNAKRIFSTFAAVSKDESGTTSPISNPCGGCSAISCDSCGL